METEFDGRMAQVRAKFKELLACAPVHFPLRQTDLPDKGIYLLSEGEKYLYVGRSDGMRRRLNQHKRESASTNSASFAAMLARKACNISREYGPHKKRARHPDWDQSFAEAKSRIRAMGIRFVEETDPVCQALLEIYTAVELKTPHNDFGNH